MNRGLALVMALLAAGLMLYTIRKGTQQARNERAIEQIYSGDRVRPDSRSQPGIRPRSTGAATQGGAVRKR